MPKAYTSMGASVGGLIGLFVGILIPVSGEIKGSFFTRVTQHAVELDTIGFLLSLTYTIMAIFLGYAIGSLTEHLKNP